MMRSLGSVLVPVALLALFASGCQRSAQYEKDQEYYKEPYPSYYNQGAPTQPPTSRLEKLGQPKKRVVVLDFWNDTPVRDAGIGRFASDELKRGLQLTQRLILADEVKSDLATQDLVEGNQVKVSQLVREGRRLGVSVLVIGRVPKIVFRQRGDDVGLLREVQTLAAADVEIKVFDVAAGRELLSTGRSGESSSTALAAFNGDSMQDKEFREEMSRLAVRNAIEPLIPEITRSIEKMAWEGRVAKIAGTKVYLNSGRASGLLVGDILRVLSSGEEVHDPTTGAFLGRTPGQLKGTLEVVDFLGTDAAVAQIHSGGNFREGDAVQLY